MNSTPYIPGPIPAAGSGEANHCRIAPPPWPKQARRWLPQILTEVADNRKNMDSLLTEAHGPTAGQVLCRIAEAHSQSATRWEAGCGLALQQMEIASWIPEVASEDELSTSPLFARPSH
jgi:hypothetical protein